MLVDRTGVPLVALLCTDEDEVADCGDGCCCDEGPGRLRVVNESLRARSLVVAGAGPACVVELSAALFV